MYQRVMMTLDTSPLMLYEITGFFLDAVYVAALRAEDSIFSIPCFAKLCDDFAHDNLSAGGY